MKNVLVNLRRSSLTFMVVHLLTNSVILTLTQSEECQTLPPNVSASLSQNDSVDSNIPQDDKQQQIIIRGMDQLHFDQYDKKAIFMLGNTGSGKTTITQILNGNLSQLHAVLTQSDDLVIIDVQNRIGLPTTTSKTLVPEYVRNPDNNVPFYDCPGFDDNRGPESDIAAMYFVNSITEHVEQAKFLFIVTHSSVIMGNDRLDFDLLATHASQFLLNVPKFSNSIGMIVSKVNSYSPQGRYISDSKVMTGILGFLYQFHSTLLRNLQRAEHKDAELLQRKIQFVEALLVQDGNGSYSKIWFVRSPPQCGAFSEIPYYQEVRNKITDLYTNQLVYSPTASTDFGITLKAETLLKINREYVPQLLDDYINRTEETLNELFANYRHEFEDKDNYNTKGKFRIFFLKLNNVYHNLSSLHAESNPGLECMEKVFLVMNYTVPEVYLNETRKIEKVLKFYEKVTMTNITRPSIAPQIHKLQTAVQGFREKTFTLIKNAVIPRIVSEISELVTNLVGKVEELYEQNFYNDLNRVSTSAKVQVLKNDVQRMQILREKWETNVSISIATEIEEVYFQFGYNISKDQIKELGQYENVLILFEELMATKIRRPTGEWLRIPLKLFGKLDYLRDWYEFLVLTDEKLMSYATQREISGLRGLSTISNFTDSMTVLRNISGSFLTSNIMNIAETQANETEKTKLVNIIRNAFAPTKVECSANGGKAVVTGNFVKFTDFMTNSSELPCGWKLKELEIFASEKLFFDTDVLAMGRDLTIRIIADVWEVIDHRTIELKGLNGEPHVPTKAEGFAENGKPGLPGGNGGSFYGIYGTILNGDKLTLNVNGGDGGDGQEGANGKDGANGRDAEQRDFPSARNTGSVVWEEVWNPRDYGVHSDHLHKMAGKLGEVGGNGGSGGSGGQPGYPGTVSVSQVYPYDNGDSQILVRSQRGNAGQPGKGGIGGLGGRKGHSLSCILSNTLSVPYWRKCRVERRDVVAVSGVDGLTGGNSGAKIYPMPPTPFAGKINSETISDFKNFILVGGSCRS